MADLKPIRIVGGGLAGLTLGIGLRQHQVPVTLLEAGHYPRHRVCGEFISGRGQTTLERLDLMGRLLQAGARWAANAALYFPAQPPVQQSLPEPGLCLSRFTLDALLAQEFTRSGGELHPGERWSDGPCGEGVIRATGRQVQATVGGWRWLGLKVHARGVILQADLEMHLVSDGYVGLCQLDGECNVCGLFRTRTPLPHLGRHWREWLRGEPGSALRERLGEAVLDEDSFCSVAGLCLEPRRAPDHGECALGDALTMTPPITGNGMSMALESAESAVQPLLRYSRGELGWDEARREIARECNHRFRPRLRSAARLHTAMFHPFTRSLLASVLPRFPGLLRVFFARTR